MRRVTSVENRRRMLWRSVPRQWKILSSRFFFFEAEDGIRDLTVTGVQTCALPIWSIALERRLETAEATVPVIGAGYVGLPLALALAGSGYRLWALDVDPAKVGVLKIGRASCRERV